MTGPRSFRTGRSREVELKEHEPWNGLSNEDYGNHLFEPLYLPDKEMGLEKQAALPKASGLNANVGIEAAKPGRL